MGQPGTAPLRSGVLSYHAAAEVSFAAAWGSLVGVTATGNRRKPPARASAPALFLPGESAGSTARLGVLPSPKAHPRAETGTQLTATAQGPRHRAVAVHQAGAP